MIQSMTGFGKATKQLPSKKITVEIRSLNSKGLDLSVRMPGVYKEMELGLRKELGEQLKRGKIEMSLFVESTSEEGTAKINKGVVAMYMQQLRDLSDGADIDFLNMAVKMPDAFKTEREELNEQEWEQIYVVIEEAIQNIINFRTDEGVSLENEFSLRIENIRLLMNQAIALAPERIALVKEKLKSAIDDLKVTIDENRFEQELIYYLEKLDVTEEHVRLNNHLNYFLETIAGNDDNGRKLGFISQEIGREINTLGSKSNHAEMQKLVVQMKDELEKIKEQVLNVL
ncbi:MAG: YicC family protein [Flavobacteriales bacterium]|nr:YicC family protein [Flavobacteriales bacterium]